MLTKNQIVHAHIEGYTSEGLGIARVEGQVVFVHRAICGEDCDILILKVLKNTAFGKVIGIEQPSAHRMEPVCPYYGKCGGCDFQHMDYAEELQAKHQRVQDALQRLGGSDVAVEKILGAAEPYHYRNKTQYSISPAGIGFYHARSHTVTPTDRCLIQMPQADAAASALRDYMEACHVSAYDEDTRRGLLRYLFVRTNEKGESLICIVATALKLPREKELEERLRAACPNCIGIVLCRNTRPGSVVLGDCYRTLWGKDVLDVTLCDLHFRISIPSFYQVNHDQAEVLYRKAVEFADLHGTELVLDLYCGAGTITQVMAQHCAWVIGAEIVPSAIENARKTAVKNGLQNVEFFCGDAKAVAGKLAGEHLHPDVICVDPPRKGLDPEVVEAVCAMEPKRVVYVSCDPATLGRDVKRFTQLGYTCTRAAAVDLFPRTANVESVALLSKTRKK